MPHWAHALGAVGGQTPPAPAKTPVVHDIEGGHAWLPALIPGPIVMKGAPAQIAASDALHLGFGRELGEQVERRDVPIHPADHSRARPDPRPTRMLLLGLMFLLC